MTADRDVTRFVRAWLEDGATVLPDRVLDSVLDQLPATPQRRHLWPAWRELFVMNTMRWGLAAGVVVFATVVGLGLYLNQGLLVGPDQPTPTPSVAPTQATSPTETVEPTSTPEPTPAARSFSEVSDDMFVPAGTWVTDGEFLLDITFSVPSGWQKWGERESAVGILKNQWRPPRGSGLGFMIVDEMEVSADPCRWQGDLLDVDPSVEAFAEALANRPNQQASEPVDISLAGYAGKYLEVTVPDDVSQCDERAFHFWQAADDSYARDDPYGAELDRFWILDVEGVRLAINVAYLPGTSEADLAELEQMVQSIRISPPEASQAPTTSPSPLPRFFASGSNVAAGTYLTGTLFPLEIEFTVPAGWQSWSVSHDGVGVSKYGAGPPAGSGFGFWIVGQVYPNPCARLTRPPVDPGPSVDDLAEALQNLENYRTTSPVDVSLGGYSGKYLEITAPTDLTLSGCEAADPRLWRTEGLGDRSVYGPDEHDRIWILDVDGTRLLVKMAYRPGTPEADIGELEQMVDSIRISPPEASQAPLVADASAMSFSRIGGIAGADVPAGTYVTDLSFPLQVQFTVPEGWQRWTAGNEATGVYKHGGERPLGSRFGFWLIDTISKDPCDPSSQGLSAGTTAEGLATALQAIESWSPTAATDVSLGGHSGKYVELTAPDELGLCRDSRGLGTPSFLGQTIGPGSRWQVWALDVDGGTVVVAISYRPPTPESDVAELQQIVDSVVIQPSS